MSPMSGAHTYMHLRAKVPSCGANLAVSIASGLDQSRILVRELLCCCCTTQVVEALHFCVAAARSGGKALVQDSFL